MVSNGCIGIVHPMECLQMPRVVGPAALLFSTQLADQRLTLLVHSVVVLPASFGSEDLCTCWAYKGACWGEDGLFQVITLSPPTSPTPVTWKQHFHKRVSRNFSFIQCIIQNRFLLWVIQYNVIWFRLVNFSDVPVESTNSWECILAMGTSCLPIVELPVACKWLWMKKLFGTDITRIVEGWSPKWAWVACKKKQVLGAHIYLSIKQKQLIKMLLLTAILWVNMFHMPLQMTDSWHCFPTYSARSKSCVGLRVMSQASGTTKSFATLRTAVLATSSVRIALKPVLSWASVWLFSIQEYHKVFPNQGLFHKIRWTQYD